MSGGRVALALVALVAILAAGSARAQLFSPGTLSKSHAALDGLSGCTQCHVEGGQHDNNKCLACHKEIGKRLEAADGYHNSVRTRLCAECHREHRGEKSKLIEWQPSKDAFNHSLTGWSLAGNHKKPECKACHDVRRVESEDVRALIQKKGRESYLGLVTACASCHFDEHRGQEGGSCDHCHTPEQPFKKAPAFNHNDRSFTKYTLLGKHKQVKCDGCHEQLLDTTTPSSAFPAPHSSSFLQMKDLPHASCTACHDDPHRGNFGRSCEHCHTEQDWSIIKEGAQDTGFHDKHAFKLRGEHQSVACRSCHGPFGNEPPKWKGLKFQHCSDCHADAHEGQLPLEEGAVHCEKCHTVAGFTPVLFDVDMHEQTRFPLEGSHRSVACNLCHRAEPKIKERFSSKARAELERKGRKVIASGARLVIIEAVADPIDESRAPDAKRGPSDCSACHADVHGGQFLRAVGVAPARIEKKVCGSCHQATSFADVTFKHDDSRFPLTGLHNRVHCAACHTAPKAVKGKPTDIVVYRGMSLACGSCHADVHVGQLAQVDCQACHTTTGFKPAKFDHDKQSTFALVGQHKTAKCTACHQEVDAHGEKIVRYKPLPASCADCHVDEHKGAFDKYNPKLDGKCEGCHSPADWAPAKFAHTLTGFELTGQHASARCGTCHGNTYERPVPASCASCHQDPHAEEFGLQCASCHTTAKFEGPAFPIDAHRKTAFPLIGRHGALPCDECHVEKRESGFTRAALDCAVCHANDARAASIQTVDHSRAPFGGASCGSCHIPTTFTPARFVEHEKCFPIGTGVHAPFQCEQCHKSLAGAHATGACKGVPVLCADCHDHSSAVEDKRHLKVPGYEHKSEKCAGCHGP